MPASFQCGSAFICRELFWPRATGEYIVSLDVVLHYLSQVQRKQRARLAQTVDLA